MTRHARIREPLPVLRFEERQPGIPGFSIEESKPASSSAHHKHEDFSILFFNCEGCTHEMEGRKIDVRPGQIYFIPPYLAHYATCPPGAPTTFIYFKSDFLHLFPAIELQDLDLVSLERYPELAPFVLQHDLIYELHGKDREDAAQKCKTMLREYSDPRIGSETLIRCNLKLLILQVVRLYEPLLRGLVHHNRQILLKNESVSKVLSYIGSHLHHKISLEEAARSAALSPNYLSHLIKRETGRTFTQLVTQRRLARAEELLRFTSLRMKEIAEQLGYSDESYFSRQFRTHEGISPREFREEFAAHNSP